MTRVLVEHYDRCLAARGPTVSGMDWGDDGARLDARFDAICRAIGLGEHRRRLSILDAGCGCGLFLDHLRKHFPGRVEYTGLDASAAMIAAARTKHPSARWILGDVTEDRGTAADWVVANGLLTERRTVGEREMRSFACDAVAAMFERSREGIVFNVMSAHVNYREEHLFYWDPGDLLAHVTAALSRHVVIFHDLETYDYFCCVRRHARTHSGAPGAPGA